MIVFISRILFLLLFLTSCSAGDKPNMKRPEDKKQPMDSSKLQIQANLSNKEFEEVWVTFANAVLSDDFKKIKQLSSNCIYCTDCVTNTLREDSLFNNFKRENPNSWFDKKYSELCYIPIDTFLNDDYPIAFDSIVKSRFFNKSKIRFVDDKVNKHLYSKSCIINSNVFKNSTLTTVFVKTIDWSTEVEGMDKIFTFIKTKSGYKFCGYTTMP